MKAAGALVLTADPREAASRAVREGDETLIGAVQTGLGGDRGAAAVQRQVPNLVR